MNMKKMIGALTAKFAVALMAFGCITGAWAATQVGTWADLVSAANSGGEIVLSGDITDIPVDGDSIELDNEQSVELDLAGHSISVPADWFSSGFISIGDGVTFVIKGGGMIDASSRAEDDFFTLIDNYGTLTIKSGVTIKANAEAYAYALSCGDEGTTIVENGVVLEGYVYPDGFTFAADGKTVVGKHTVSGGNPVVESSASDPVVADSVVAKIGDTEYTSLAAAISDVPANGTETTIVMQSDSTANSMVTIASGKNVRLDLNGHNIVNAKTDDSERAQYALYNEGILTIVDSTDDGTTGGCVYTMNVVQRGNHVIVNTGTLTIEGGWFGDSDNDKTNANELSVGQAVYNTGTAVINGGHFTAVDNNFTTSPYRFAYALCSDTDGATMIINNADVYGAMNGVISATKGGDVTINGGNFYLGRANATTYVYRLIYTTDSSIVEVKGGNWTANNSQKTGEEDFKGSGTSQILLKGGTFTLQNGFPYASEGACGVAVSGGVYSKTVPAYCCATDYSPVANTDPETSAAYPYTVVSDYVAQIVKNEGATTNKYTTLSAAIEAAQNGETVEVFAGTFNIGSDTITINKSITLTGQSKAGTVLEFNFTAAGTGLSIEASNATVKDMTIRQSTVDSVYAISVPRGGSQNNYSIAYSNVVIKSLNIEGGKYAINMTGYSFAIEDCNLSGQTGSSQIEIYAYRGDCRIANCTFVGDGNNSHYNIMHQGGNDGSNLEGIYSSGTLTISGNKSKHVGVFYVFNQWGMIDTTRKMNLIITGNEIGSEDDAHTNKGLNFYKSGANSDSLSALFNEITVTNNAFYVKGATGAIRPLIRRDDGITDGLTINASYNYWGYWGHETSDFNNLFKTDGATPTNIDYEPYYITYNPETGALSDLRPLPKVAQIISANGATTNKYESLAQAIKDVQAGETIQLLSNVTWDGTAEDPAAGGTGYYSLTAAGNVTIDGNGYTLFGAGATPTDSAIMLGDSSWDAPTGAGYVYTITNMTFSGFSSVDHGVLRAQGVTANVIGCTFTDNASSKGWGVVSSSHANLNVKDCVFSGTTSGKCIDFGSNGNNANDITLSVDNCRFNNNQLNGSGVIYVAGSIAAATIGDCSFSGNAVASDGAAVVYCSDTTEVTGCLFMNNTVTVSGSGNKCGVLALGSGATNSVFTENAFVDNTTTYEGGSKATIYVGATGVDLADNYWGDGAAPETGDGSDIYIASGKSATYATYASSYEVIGNGVTVTRYVPPVAQIVCIVDDVAVTNEYTSLAAAIADVPTDGTATTITMIANEAIDIAGNALEIAVGKNVVLDLNGHQVVGFCSTGENSALILNNGTLTVVDSTDVDADGTGDGKLMYSASPSWNWSGVDGDYSGSYASNLISNNGTVRVESGFLEVINPAGKIVSASFVIDSASGGTVVITGGKLSSSCCDVIRMRVSNSAESELNISGGSVVALPPSNRAIWLQKYSNNAKSTVNVSGGLISGSMYSIHDDSSGSYTKDTITGGTFYGFIYTTAELDISGGEFNGGQANAWCSIMAYSSKASISGGVFVGRAEFYSGASSLDWSVTGGAFSNGGPYQYAGNTSEKFVRGGIYDAVPRYLAPGYLVVDNTDTETQVAYPNAVVPAVASITADDETVYYATFEDAIDDAELDDSFVITVIGYDAATMVAPDGWKFVTENDVTTLVRAHYVAQIVTNEGASTNKYESLLAAYGASASGDTIEMIADDRLDEELAINRSVTITGAVDEDGKPLYTIYGKPTDNLNVDIFVKNASSAIDVTIQNVNISEFGHQYASGSQNGALYVSRSTHVDTHVLVSNVTISAYNNYAIIAPQGKLEVVDCAIDGYKDTTYGAICTGGIWSGDMFDDLPSSTVSVLRTTIVNLNSNKSGTTAYAIDARAGSTVVVEDCTITNVRDGIASVAAQQSGNGGTSVNVSGTTVEAARNALAISGNPTYLGGSVIAELNVSSGTFVGAVVLPQQYEDYGIIAISGGYFSQYIVEDFCDSGYLCTTKPTANGMYQVVPAATVTYTGTAPVNVTGFALPDPASFTYPSGDLAEIALSLPTYTATDTTFAGWKIDGKGDAIAVLPSGTATNVTLVATWTVAQTIEVTATTNEVVAQVEIKVTDAWIEANVTNKTGSAESPTAADIQDALNETADNGLKVWENYVIGQDPNTAVAVGADQGANITAMPVSNTLSVQPVDTGFTVEYSLKQVDTNGTEIATVETKQTTDFDIDLSTVESNAYYVMTATIKTDDGATVSTVTSTNVIGVLKVESGATTTAVAVPWASYDGTNDISVADIVRTANLTPGDELKAYAPDGSGYKAWTLNESKEWEPVKVVGGSSETDADAFTVKRGSAVWLTRQDTSTPIYLVGGVAESKDKVEVELEAGTTDNPSWNLVGSAGTEPVNVNAIGAATTDKIIVPTATVPKNYEYNTEKGEWGYWDYETVIKPSGRKTVTKVWKSASVETIPAGTGFWYLNGGDSKDINL